MAKFVRMIIAAVAVAFLVGCSTQVSKSDIESQVGEQFAKAIGTKADSVTCPSGLEAKVGATMTCVVTRGGMAFDLKVTVRNVADKVVNYDITVVGEPRKAG